MNLSFIFWLLIFLSFANADEVSTKSIEEAKNSIEDAAALVPEKATKDWVKNNAGTILKGVSTAFTLFKSGYEFFAGDPLINTLKKQTETLLNKMNEISNEIKRATNEINAYMEFVDFRGKVIIPVNNLQYHVSKYLENRDSLQWKNELKDLCRDAKHKPITILNTMKDLISTGVMQQLKAEEYTDQAWDKIDEIYGGKLIQLELAYPVCSQLLHNQEDSEAFLKLIKEIDQMLDGVNFERGEKYWTSDLMIPLIKRNLDRYGNDVANNGMWEELNKKYGKSGYHFATGCYDAVTGWWNHGLKVPFHVFRHNDKNGFIMRRSKALTRFQKVFSQPKVFNMNAGDMFRFTQREPFNVFLDALGETDSTASIAVVRYINKHYHYSYDPEAFDLIELKYNSPYPTKIPPKVLMSNSLRITY